ncbi:NACHT domain- and WD repeat-containing protein 1-like isoform X1 [Asterias rubens]|uniref:NACHT domain- and WD repeat-containing protein 1-like isoform X1 n=2 Tax=Asterias rubens TaxID=7604 RepID=UPI001455C622|nr:NACHT domain- and WD repeat-containing protein 1-like isoform X1 [Asterias rubens]
MRGRMSLQFESRGPSAQSRGKKGSLQPMSQEVRLGPNGRRFTSASFAPGQTSLEDHGHLRGTDRRISTRNSKVIVSYLRKQLRQRLLQGSIPDDALSHSYEESLDDPSFQVPPNAKYGRHNMFSRYTDYGGRQSRVRPDSPEGLKSSEEAVEGRELSPLRQVSAQGVLPNRVRGGSRGPEVKISEGWAQGDGRMPPLTESKTNIDAASKTGENTPTKVEATKALAPRTVDANQKGYRSGSPALSLKSLKSTGSGDSHDGSYDSAQSLTHLPRIGSTVSAGTHRPASALSIDEDVRLPVIGKDSKAISQPDETSISDEGSEKLKLDSGDGSKGLILSDAADETTLPLDDTDGCIPPREEVSPVPSQYPLPHDRMTVDCEEDECINRLMMGYFDAEFPMEKKIIRIFISSTFSDFEAERTALVSKVYPRLKSYCKERGYEFQVCDPHWGIKEFSNDSHTYAQHCLSELEECQRVSKGPNFVSILGQKCGFEPVPASISVDDFEGLITGLQNAKELSLATRRTSRVSSVSEASPNGEYIETRERRGSILPTLDEKRTSSNDPPKSTLASTLEDGEQPQLQSRTKKISDHRKPQIASSTYFKERGVLVVNAIRATDQVKRREDSIEGGGVYDVDSEQEKQTEKEYDAEITLLRNWFQLDENSLAPCYRLQNISSVFKDVLSNDKQKKQRARNQWFFVQIRLLKIMHRYMKEEDQRRDYCMSVTEKEVETGILGSPQDVHGKVLSFKRFITDLHLHLQDYNARDYINLHPMRPEVDLTSLEKIDDLREVQITEKLKYTDIHEFTTEWHKDGINPSSNRSHSQYLDKFANEFHDSLKVMIDSATSVNDRSSIVPEENAFYWCVAPHVNFVQNCIKSFHGCSETLFSIKHYIRSNAKHPLAIHGPSGSGKTSIVAKAAELVRDWTKSEELAVIVRFIGLTSDSHHIRKILTDICRQICHIYGQDASSIPEDYFGLMNDLENRFRAASSQRPLVIFLDALDQLSDENNARNLMWLPKNLPEHVHLVVTTVTIEEEQHECFKVLKKVLPEASLLPIPNLSPTDTSFILSHRLALKNRRLTSEQRSAVMKACEENASPLFVTLAADEAARWNSQLTGRALFLPGTLKKLVNHIIIRLESTYGEPLVRRTLGYITASQNGLSWSELEDLLSLDDAVMNDVVAQNGTSLRRLPPVLWCRLRAELEQYLSLGVVDGCWTYRWLHREFFECATERYLKQRDKAPSYHSALSEFFMGKWGNIKKPFPGNDGGAERFVDPMPLVWNHLFPNGESKPVNNLRKLNELPYHLLHSNQLDKLKTEVLINYEWTLAKLKATSLRILLDDVQSALIVKPNDLELRLMSDTLQLSAVALGKDPNQLGSQLMGRLYNIIATDKPMSVGDPKKYPSVAVMFGALNRSSVPLLMPSATCLSQPGGVLFDLLAGHTSEITAVTVSSDGSIAGTASTDGTVKMWDLRSRKVLKTLPKMGMEVSIIRFALRNHILIAVTYNKIHVWDLDKCILVGTMEEYIDPPSITIAGEDEQYLCAFFSGINAMRTWELGGGECCLVAGREIAGEGIHKDQSVCVSIGTSGEKVLYAFRSDNKAYVVNAKTGQRLHELKAPGQAASVTALGISKDYYIVVCRYLYMKLSEIHQLELYDVKTGKYERAVKGCTHDVVNELYVNRMGSHALCLCPSAQSNTSHISVWNLETEDHKHMAKHAQMSTMGACVDLSFCLSASRQDKALRIWNISKNVNDREGTDSKSKKREGVSSLVPMINNPRYVVAKSIDNGPLSVWNVLKGKCSGNAVRIERGLVDQHDVFLIRNHKAVILSDRGMSSVSEKPTPVFQTVFMYNLKLKKYYRKLTGVFIVPSPAHEYRLLDGELLLGLSESRDHLICWSLVTGHIKFRIKSKFKELERWRGMRRDEEEALRQRTKRGTSAKMTPWDRRSESHTARQRRRDSEFSEEKKRLDDLRKEKENAIEQYVMSKDEKVIVCCYFAHHMCVFDVETQSHLQTLENESSMLYLFNSALTHTGSFLAHANYDDCAKCSYVTLWDLQSGQVRKRIKNEPNVCCVGINSDATRVFFGKESNILKIWDVRRKSTLRKLRGYKGMKLTMESKIFMIDDGARAIVFATDISLWDLDRGTMVALFTPDIRITCVEVVMSGKLIVLGLRESADLITLKLRGRDIKAVDLISGAGGEELFGETTGDTTEEEDEEDEEESEVASNKGSEQSY